MMMTSTMSDTADTDEVDHRRSSPDLHHPIAPDASTVGRRRVRSIAIADTCFLDAADSVDARLTVHANEVGRACCASVEVLPKETSSPITLNQQPANQIGFADLKANYGFFDVIQLWPKLK